MTAPSYTAHWTNTAERTAETWAESDKAKALLSRFDMLERLSDSLASGGYSHTLDGIADDINDLEVALDNFRTEALSEAWAEYPGTDDDAQWELEELAPTVEDVLKAARKARSTALADVTWIMPGRVAA